MLDDEDDPDIQEALRRSTQTTNSTTNTAAEETDSLGYQTTTNVTSSSTSFTTQPTVEQPVPEPQPQREPDVLSRDMQTSTREEPVTLPSSEQSTGNSLSITDCLALP